jgi:hypothetical protein
MNEPIVVSICDVILVSLQITLVVLVALFICVYASLIAKTEIKVQSVQFNVSRVECSIALY